MEADEDLLARGQGTGGANGVGAPARACVTWAAICSIAVKIGCSGETLRSWVRQRERDDGLREGMTSEVRERLKALERENRELRQANEILRKASAYFAQAELDRRSRT
jgi:transposase